MLAKITQAPFKSLAIIVLVAAGFLFAWVKVYEHYQQKQRDYYTVGLIISTVEASKEDVAALKLIMGKKLESFNKQGGIGNRPVKLLYLDDAENNDKLYKLVQQSIKDKDLIAYIGGQGSSRAKTISGLLAKENVPFIGGYALTPLVEKYPNMFSAEVGIKEVSVVIQKLLQTRATRGAFIGRRNDLYAGALLHEMEKRASNDPGFRVTIRKWFPIDHKFSPDEIRNLTDSLKHHADFLMLSTEVVPTDFILNALWENNVKLPVFCGSTDISQLDPKKPYYHATELYDINAFSIPGTQNMRLQEQFSTYQQELQQSSTLNYQLGLSARHSDELDLLREASSDKTLPANANIRARIVAGLNKYINGHKIYRGAFADWYFTPERAFAGEPLLVWKPANYDNMILAPLQFLRTSAGLQKAHVLYTNIDVMQISRISDEEGTFSAKFYLKICSEEPFTIADIDFANAARSALNHEPLIEMKLVRSGKDLTIRKRPLYNYLYKISGKFFFNPELQEYPVDEQKFPISLQSSNALKAIMVQPSENERRDTLFESKGWKFKRKFVGFDHELISSSGTFSSLQKNIPYYKFSYVYVLKRQHIDFFLKTLVPLLSLLFITYFSVYIPPRQFEALTTIQVTALLSSIALYFSASKSELAYATISDKIFIFTYIMITSLLGTSILLYIMHNRNNGFTRMVRYYQYFAFPVIITGYVIYIRWF